MKIGILFVVLLVATGAQSFIRTQDADEKAHQQWLEARYKEATSIKPGMTRADLLKLFWPNGGFITTTQYYSLKTCPLIKIGVSFDKDDFSHKQPDDSVKIVEVSKPYLEPMTLD